MDEGLSTVDWVVAMVIVYGLTVGALWSLGLPALAAVICGLGVVIACNIARALG